MEKVLTVLSFFLLVLITTFPLNSASASQPQDLCCASNVESVIASTASGCICDDDIQIDMENLALINVTRMMMMKLHTVCGISLTCDDVDAPESHGLENSIANSAESPSSSSQSMSKAQPDSTAPTSVEVPDDSSDASLWIIFIVFFLLLITGASCED